MGVYRDLIAYKKAYSLAMKIFHASKKFPGEERFDLTNQIRRSSRSVCANMAEAYRRRRYPAHFVSKLWDSLSENCETEVWLYFAKDCTYITSDQFNEFISKNNEVGKLINYMIQNPDKFR